MRKAVIILPTYNEAGTIEPLIRQVFDVTRDNPRWQIEILVVDSTSDDDTGAIVKKLQSEFPRLHLLETKKEGLGKAYVRGFHYALEHIQPYLMFEMDADLSHEPSEIPVMLAEIEKGADFVIGSRYIKGGSIPSDWGVHRKLFSVLGNLIIRFGFMKLSISDWTGGFRAIKTFIIKDSLSHIQHYSGYVFQMALLDYALKKKARIIEIPIHFKERKYGRSKINSIQYIMHIILYILVHSSFVKFVIVGVIGFILDFGISYYLINLNHWIKWKATVVSAEIAIISNFMLNNFWSFSHKKLDHKFSSYFIELLKFNAVSSGSIVIQAVGIELLSHLFGGQWWFVYKFFIITCVIIPYSYILYNKFIWKEK